MSLPLIFREWLNDEYGLTEDDFWLMSEEMKENFFADFREDMYLRCRETQNEVIDRRNAN